MLWDRGTWGSADLVMHSCAIHLLLVLVQLLPWVSHSISLSLGTPMQPLPGGIGPSWLHPHSFPDCSVGYVQATPISSIPTQPYHPFHFIPGALDFPKTFSKRPFVNTLQVVVASLPPNYFSTLEEPSSDPAHLCPIQHHTAAAHHWALGATKHPKYLRRFLAAVCLFPDVCASFNVKYLPPSIFSTSLLIFTQHC